MTIFKKIFKEKSTSFTKGKTVKKPHRLRVEGIAEAPVTAEPDDAELAAQALLDSLAEVMEERRVRKRPRGKTLQEERTERDSPDNQPSARDVKYYKALAEKIRQAHEVAERRAKRFVAACEYALKNKHLPFYGEGSLSLLETELYKRIDIIERAGGELKLRWQHCLAEVTSRLMSAPSNSNESDNDTPNANGGDSGANPNPADNSFISSGDILAH